MKQLATAALLSAALLSSATFAANTTPLNMTQAADAEMWLSWSANPDQPATFPIDTNGRDAYITVSVSGSNYWNDNSGSVQVLWNDQVLSGGEVIKIGSAIVAHISGSGTLTIKDRGTSAKPDPDDWYYCDNNDWQGLWGDITLHIL